MKELLVSLLGILSTPTEPEPVRPHEEVEEAARRLEVEIEALDTLIRRVEEQVAARS